MTSPARYKVQRDSGDTTQTIIDWAQLNARLLTIVGTIVIVLGVGIWFYARSTQIQAANAGRQLVSAKQSMAAGNLPLAQTDLQRVIARYPRTPSAVEAALLLGQIEFDQGRHEQGLEALRAAARRRAAGPFRPALFGLIGDGTLQLNRPADAATAYQEAATAAARFPHTRSFYRAKAARAHLAAGDTARARQIWSELADERVSESVSAEARLRLGELTARAASGS